MSNYYKSKEVYKQHRDAVTHEPKIIPVRGLYVSGDHLEPTYIDHNVTITQCTSTSMTIVDYVDRTIDVPTDHSVNILDFYQTGSVSAIDLRTTYTDTTPQSCISVSVFTSTDLTIT